jgi:FkbM family methyltransferase
MIKVFNFVKFIATFFYWFYYKNNKFSQGNEESILNKIFNAKEKGFYVDVGCHHPKRFSNTALLYKKGWHGINIDADYKNLKLFKFFRKRDININALVSSNNFISTFHFFNESALNGIYGMDRVESLVQQGYKHLKSEKINTISLNQILSNSKIDSNFIDLLDIDVEGHDFEVLKSIDLNKYEVKVILIEIGDNKNEITDYLASFNYKPFKMEDRNYFYMRN